MKRIIRKSILLIFCLVINAIGAKAYNGKILPVSLKCELKRNPLGVDIPKPDFSYTLNAVSKTAKGLFQTAYQVLVGVSGELLKNDNGDLWNSGKVSTASMAYINYAGKPLRSNMKCWWKVRVWDQDGNVSAWSEVATFTMGILNNEDWKASWLTATDAENYALSPFGFRSQQSSNPNTKKWVQVDLQREYPISAVRLTPVFFEDRAGYGFPSQFTIEISNDPNFTSSEVVADYATIPFNNPGWKPALFPVSNKKGRYVRVTAFKLWQWNHYCHFALRQLEILNDSINVASGKPVTASDINEADGWSKSNLTDQPPNKSAIANFSSLLLRKEFAVPAGLVRAVIHVSGLSEYELSVNGKKTGDYLLTPGWTDYKKTVLYDTYDITEQLKKGNNAIGIFMGNGMYNIQPDPVRYVKFLNTFGPLKAIAQLYLEFANGDVKVLGTDAGWQAAPGPVTYSNMFGGEDFDANKVQPGWNNPHFKTTENWAAAMVTSGPGGNLKGLSCAAPPVKIIERFKPVKVTRLKDNLLIYDFGQNASMMPALQAIGPKGSYIRMIPAELLGQDGLVDRKSATQDGARPAWWQYTFAGNGVEVYNPKFFYQGARYLQVELYPSATNETLPQIVSLEDQLIQSSSTPAGKFSCSNDLFNRIYDLVRWAQRSNMMSYMTDCPHREKLGWLEENHLNGPALRYNFDMASFFRKTMNDMADAQLPNGFVPNIAPEYFIAGSADLSNNFRNSPEWGSSFIIVPWQQYLFSGDISLLQRYYERMKKYVNFLATSAKDDIITTGLGDWYDIGPKPAWGSQLTPVSFTATAIYYYDNLIMYNIARRLGKENDADYFKTSGEKIRAAFNNNFFNPATGLYATGSNTTCAMPLFFNLVEPQNRQKLLQSLVDSIRRHGNSFTSGEVGYRFLLRALSDGGYSDVVYDMNNQSEKPGYGYQLKMGATSLTEKWDAGVGDFGSQNHFMSGQINEWLFNDLLGISPDEAGPGFKKFIVKPAVAGDLTWVKGSFNSMSGNISSAWQLSDHRFLMNITIPPNTSATIYVPAKNKADLNDAVNNKNGKCIRYENGYGVYAVGSGVYQFSSKWQ